MLLTPGPTPVPEFVRKAMSDVTIHHRTEEFAAIFKNTRELMQFIGTDLIREYCSDWHINKVREIIETNGDKNFVIDDVRFPNERELIESLGGTLWFVVRPKLDNVSNHISETALKWQEFDNIIVNNKLL